MGTFSPFAKIMLNIFTHGVDQYNIIEIPRLTPCGAVERYQIQKGCVITAINGKMTLKEGCAKYIVNTCHVVDGDSFVIAECIKTKRNTLIKISI
jgi:hypothetical protein